MRRGQIVVLVFLLSVIVSYIVVVCESIYSFEGFDPITEESIKYSDEIKNLKEEILDLETIINLKDNTDFEWDRAYIVPRKDLAYDKLDNILGADCNLSPIVRESNSLMIVFLKSTECVYEYYYDTRLINFSSLGKFIYKENSNFRIASRNISIKFEWINNEEKDWFTDDFIN